MPFFDRTEIQGMDDWRDRILQGLRQSHLLIACVTPSYLASEYCEWEFIEYLKKEVARGYVGEGVAPIYLVDLPARGDGEPGRSEAGGSSTEPPSSRRPPGLVRAGDAAIRESACREPMAHLIEQIAERIHAASGPITAWAMSMPTTPTSSAA